jgi:hypothetical protein
MGTMRASAFAVLLGTAGVLHLASCQLFSGIDGLDVGAGGGGAGPATTGAATTGTTTGGEGAAGAGSPASSGGGEAGGGQTTGGGAPAGTGGAGGDGGAGQGAGGNGSGGTGTGGAGSGGAGGTGAGGDGGAGTGGGGTGGGGTSTGGTGGSTSGGGSGGDGGAASTGASGGGGGSGGAGGAGGGGCTPTSCEEDEFCPLPEDSTCAPCGQEPPAPDCDDTAPGNCVGMGLSCATDTECLLHCDTVDDPPACAPVTGPIFVDARVTDGNIECLDGACAGRTIQCQGPHTCFVHCDGAGSCDDLVLLCSPDGPCTLECKDDACDGVPELRCGDNRCVAACIGPMKTIDYVPPEEGSPCVVPSNENNCIVQ